jgi:hypothetical protein
LELSVKPGAARAQRQHQRDPALVADSSANASVASLNRLQQVGFGTAPGSVGEHHADRHGAIGCAHVRRRGDADRAARERQKPPSRSSGNSHPNKVTYPAHAVQRSS